MEEAEKERKEKLLFHFVPARCVIENSIKNSKQIQKIKKYHYEFISSQNRLQKDEKERNKNYRSFPFRSFRTRRVIENSKKRKKNSKN